MWTELGRCLSRLHCYWYFRRLTLLCCSNWFFWFSTVASPAYASTTSAKMIPVEVVDFAATNVAQNANLIATSAGDFGGYAYPIVGLGFLAAFILYLSPPLADE